MKVVIPEPLLPYTDRQREVEAEGATINGLLIDLDRRYPGIRFRLIDEQDKVRRNMRVFVNREQIFDLDMALSGDEEILIFHALRGG